MAGPTANERTYLLTTDLEQNMKVLRQNGYVIPGRDFFETMRVGLIQELQKCLPGVKVMWVDMEDLASQILQKALKHAEVRQGFIVSTCPEIAYPRQGIAFNINRMISLEGEILGIGPRPGHPMIRDQIRAISEQSANRPVVLIEDGAFTGSTLIYAIQALREQRVKVSTVVSGFAFPEALTRIKEHFDGEIITVRDIGTPVDWLPDHDFYPFVPNCGHVIGTKIYNHVYPLQTLGDVSYTIPYIAPFGRIAEWASVEGQAGYVLSRYCLHQASEMFRTIEQLNDNKPLKVVDLLGLLPRISVPVSLGARHLPELDCYVTEILSEAAQEIS